jgi:hypothetical protein
MKYETPKLTALTPAINAIQGAMSKEFQLYSDSPDIRLETVQAYMDWE